LNESIWVNKCALSTHVPQARLFATVIHQISTPIVGGDWWELTHKIDPGQLLMENTPLQRIRNGY